MSLPSHHDPRGGFRNPWPNSAPRGFPDVLRWTLQRHRGQLPRDPDPSVFPRVAPSFDAPHAAVDRMTMTWIGHSTLLVQLDGLNILTDPVWSERASPVRFAGPRRWVPAALPLDALPPIDLVVLSHNHYDHLDDRTVRALATRWPDARWIAPLGVADFVRRRGARRVTEHDWWDEVIVEGVRFVAVPAQHFSARSFGDRNRTLWCGWAMIGPTRRMLFGGDTGYHVDFGAIGRQCGPFDVAALPIGAYEPRWFMRTVHMNPDEAVRAFIDLRNGSGVGKSRPVMVGIHWGTFKLTDEAMDEPPRRTRVVWRAQGLPEDDLWLLAHGETRRL